MRLHFRDPNEGDLDRVQEVIARVQRTDDAGAVAEHVNGRTRAIMAVQEAARLEMQAAQQVNGGQFGQADNSLAVDDPAISPPVISSSVGKQAYPTACLGEPVP